MNKSVGTFLTRLPTAAAHVQIMSKAGDEVEIMLRSFCPFTGVVHVLIPSSDRDTEHIAKDIRQHLKATLGKDLSPKADEIENKINALFSKLKRIL